MAPTATTSLMPGTLSSRITEREPPGCEDHFWNHRRQQPGLLTDDGISARGEAANLEAAFRGGRRAADGAVSRCRDRDDGAGNGRPRFVADLSGQGCRGCLRLDLDRQDEPEKKDRQEAIVTDTMSLSRHAVPKSPRRAPRPGPTWRSISTMCSTATRARRTTRPDDPVTNGATWLAPTTVLNPRFARFNVTFNF